MNQRTVSKVATFLLGVCLAGIPAAGAAAEDKDSGFLRDYSRLEETRDTAGTTVRGWASPQFTPDNYNAIILDPLTFYPEPRPTERVSAQALSDILAYSNDALKRSLHNRFKVVNTPGPGVARIRAAISSVAAKDEGLKPYQLIPLAFIVTTAKRAASGTPQRAFIIVETEVADSETGNLLGSKVKVGTGEKLAEISQTDPITLEMLKPLLDELATNALPELSKYVKPK